MNGFLALWGAAFLRLWLYAGGLTFAYELLGR